MHEEHKTVYKAIIIGRDLRGLELLLSFNNKIFPIWFWKPGSGLEGESTVNKLMMSSLIWGLAGSIASVKIILSVNISTSIASNHVFYLKDQAADHIMMGRQEDALAKK